MAEVSRITCIWSGFAGAPGYSKFSFMPLADDTARNAAGTALRTFWDAIRGNLPNGTSIQVQPVVDDLDLVSGALVSSATMSSTPAVVTSNAVAAPYAGGSGVVITWRGLGVFNGRRIMGRTFLVPMVGVFENDGTAGASSILAIQNAGTALIGTAGADLAVWQRAYDTSDPPVPTMGNVSSVTSCVVRDAASQLRSRRT